MRHSHDPNEPLPRVTPALLRAAETMCARRLEREHHGARGNRRGTQRFRVANQIELNVRHNHLEVRAPNISYFAGSDDLVSEQRAVYDNAAAWYVSIFADRAVRSVDVEFETEHVGLGVRMIGPAGLAVESDDGTRELRVLRIGGPPLPQDPFDASDVRFAYLRRAEWIGTADARVVLADLAQGVANVAEPGDRTRSTELDAWLTERVTRIRARVATPSARAGTECGSCPFVAGCPAHRPA